MSRNVENDSLDILDEFAREVLLKLGEVEVRLYCERGQLLTLQEIFILEKGKVARIDGVLDILNTPELLKILCLKEEMAAPELLNSVFPPSERVAWILRWDDFYKLVMIFDFSKCERIDEENLMTVTSEYYERLISWEKGTGDESV